MWSSRARPITLLSLALVVGGCTANQGEGSASDPRPPLPDPSGSQQRVDPRLGLVSLPSPRQVSNAFSQGRLDPFAPPAPPSAPSGPGTTAPGGAAAATARGRAPLTPSATAVAPSTAAGAPGASAARPAAQAAPVPSAAGSGRPLPPPPAALPPDFAFTGVIASGGRIGALVQTGPNSGTVQVGETGHPSIPWLPQGWRVVGIDGAQGRLSLRRGATVRSFTLP